jgi:CDGSH-type Zn-finger protein
VSGEKKVFLCRCGGSKNKPFCDDSHLENGFQAADAAGSP